MDIKVSSMNSDGSLTISLPSISTLKVAALRTIAFPIFPTQITLKMNSASETPRILFNILFNVFVHIYQLLCRKSIYRVTVSATGSLKALGVFRTAIFSCLQASKSIESIPVPHFYITFKFLAYLGIRSVY
jgi:hypothetical protein